MELSFAKLHGLGNDFVFIDDRDRALKLTDAQVSYLCDRHFGIGADGVILVRPATSEEGDGYMHYINADGTLAQMCGNGVRCFAKYLVDRELADVASRHLLADTLAGPRPIAFSVDAGGKMTEATVNMGAPILDPALVPVDAAPDSRMADGTPYVGHLRLDSPWGAFEFACASMGKPPRRLPRGRLGGLARRAVPRRCGEIPLDPAHRSSRPLLRDASRISRENQRRVRLRHR